MLKKLSIATLIGAFALATVPALTTGALAQDAATEPPKAPAPSEAKGAAGGAMMKKSGGGAMMKKSGGGAMKKKKKM